MMSDAAKRRMRLKPKDFEGQYPQRRCIIANCPHRAILSGLCRYHVYDQRAQAPGQPDGRVPRLPDPPRDAD